MGRPDSLPVEVYTAASQLRTSTALMNHSTVRYSAKERGQAVRLARAPRFECLAPTGCARIANANECAEPIKNRHSAGAHTCLVRSFLDSSSQTPPCSSENPKFHAENASASSPGTCNIRGARTVPASSFPCQNHHLSHQPAGLGVMLVPLDGDGGPLQVRIPDPDRGRVAGEGHRPLVPAPLPPQTSCLRMQTQKTAGFFKLSDWRADAAQSQSGRHAACSLARVSFNRIWMLLHPCADPGVRETSCRDARPDPPEDLQCKLCQGMSPTADVLHVHWQVPCGAAVRVCFRSSRQPLTACRACKSLCWLC